MNQYDCGLISAFTNTEKKQKNKQTRKHNEIEAAEACISKYTMVAVLLPCL